MDSLDTSKTKANFKKREFRPWRPTLLEGATPLEFNEQSAFETAFSVEGLQLEKTLEEKNVERDALFEQLKSREDNRLLIGGFLKPTNIMLLDASAKKDVLFNELKTKEKEILDISINLKIAKSQELAEKAEMARLTEEAARIVAETKALHALEQAKISTEQLLQIESQFILEKEHLKEFEKTKRGLEAKILEIEQEVELRERERLMALEAKKIAEDKVQYALEYATHAEEKANQVLNEKIQAIELVSQNKMREAEERSQHVQMQAEQKVQALQEQLRLNEKAKLSLQAQLKKSLENTQMAEKKKREIEENLKVLEKQQEMLMAEKGKIETNLHQIVDRLKKIEILADSEKKLRKILEERTQELSETVKSTLSEKNMAESKVFELNQKLRDMEYLKQNEERAKNLAEEKIRELLEQVYEAERLRKMEETARLLAEEKINRAIEQASQTVMDVLGT